MPIDEHGLALVAERPARTSSAHLRVYHDEVCLEIRMLQPMSPAHQQLLRQAIDMIAEHSDIESQVEPISAARG